MQVGCDPASHPTKQWINDHIEEYTDDDNPAIDVAGGAVCTTDDDCTILPEGDLQFIKLITGTCKNKRCSCTSEKTWGGPRCTIALDLTKALKAKGGKVEGYGPPFELAAGIAVMVVFLTTISVWIAMRKAHNDAKAALRQAMAEKQHSVRGSSDLVDSYGPSRTDYNHNFI